MTQPIWAPGAAAIRDSNMSLFGAHLLVPQDGSREAAEALHAFSIQKPAHFWSAVWDACGVIGEKGETILENPAAMPGARFFPEARLNFAENLLCRRDYRPAIVFWGENRVKRWVSFRQLYEHVGLFSDFLKLYSGASPLLAGDRVAAIMPNMPETVTAMLGVAAIGAIWSSCSPDFGVQGVLDRFGQIEPKVLIAVDGYYYNGKTISLAEKIPAIVKGLPTLEAVVIVSYIGEAESIAAAEPKATTWDKALAEGARFVEIETGQMLHKPRFERFPFSHPLYILYSSGTTGAPKCIVHSAGGALLQHLKEHQLHCDIRYGEKLFYFTTCGWMMWNWLVSGLASGATLMLYDGSPFHPDGNMLFDFAASEGFNVFGTSAKYIDALKKAGLRPRDTHDLKNLRMMLSTGSPLAPESFDYVYDAIKPDLHLASISGGTDICSCFVLGNPNLPVRRGEIQGPGLGMAVDVVDESGAPLKRGKGELVCKKPFPAMPIGFWNDPDGAKYRGAYFERFDNIWHHGDFAEWTEHGGLIIHGRSDATLNPGGVRIGTAEIYRQVEQLPEVKESLVIGQDWDNDVRVVLFVVLSEGLTLDEDLKARIKARIREGASPRHVPALVIQIPDIPRTKSGKITEIAVREVISGREVRNKEALANPEALDYYRGLAELQR